MEDLHGPQTQVVEGAYAIKVSMKIFYLFSLFFIFVDNAHGPSDLFGAFSETTA